MAEYCLLVLGGEIRDDALFRRRLGEADQILVADSGARHLLRLGIMPEQIYGDMDSLTLEEIRQFEDGGCHFVLCPAEKDDTDGCIVLREALCRGFRDIRIWGALGGRPDHSYANMMLLQYVLLPEHKEIYSSGERETIKSVERDMNKSDKGEICGSDEAHLPDIVIEDRGIRIFLARKGQWIEGKPGEYLSLFALTPEVSGFTQKGLKYQPAEGRYCSGFPLGVSNEFVEHRVWLNWASGVLLCMHIDGAAYAE